MQTAMKAEPVGRPQALHSRSQHAQQTSLAVSGPWHSTQLGGAGQVAAGEAEGSEAMTSPPACGVGGGRRRSDAGLAETTLWPIGPREEEREMKGT
jgi:hypothetical protein